MFLLLMSLLEELLIPSWLESYKHFGPKGLRASRFEPE
jgi:hypothetical protein